MCRLQSHLIRSDFRVHLISIPWQFGGRLRRRINRRLHGLLFGRVRVNRLARGCAPKGVRFLPIRNLNSEGEEKGPRFKSVVIVERRSYC